MNYLRIMQTLTLELPDGLNFGEREAKRFLAAKMYETGRLTLVQAARLAGLSATAFSEILADYDVALVNYPASDVTDDAARI